MQNTLKSIQSVVEILGKYDHYIFDMDGVLVSLIIYKNSG